MRPLRHNHSLEFQLESSSRDKAMNLPGNDLGLDVLTTERLYHGVLAALVQVVVVKQHVIV